MGNLKSFLIFLSVVLIIYGGVNFYVYRSVMHGFALTGAGRFALKYLLILLVLAYPLGRTYGEASAPGRFLIWTGSFWLAAMTYAFMFGMIIDFARLSDLLFGWFPSWVTADRIHTGRILTGSLSALVLLLIYLGHQATLHPRVNRQTWELSRFPDGLAEYKIAVFADSHIGVIVHRARVESIVSKVNDLNADLILIIGDLVDEPPRKIPWAIEPLSKLSAPDGVYACSGNHEFYAGIKESVEFAAKAGIQMLRDRTVVIPGKVSLVMLDDITATQQFNRKMVPVAELMKDLPPDLPAIVLHHTPRRMQEAADAGADAFLSGHTHGGQLWPVGYIAAAVFGVEEGLTKFGRMNFFLTNGVGTWGPPVRVFTPAEVALITLKPER